jgi:DNA-binding NarL/FixJ family response regulator
MRAIVADDAPLWRAAVVQVLISAGMEILAEVGDADALLEAVDREPPDLVIADVRMPPTGTDDGLRAALEIRRRHANVGVLVLSQNAYIGAALDLLASGGGGVGYLLKERVSGAPELLSAVRTVARGGSRIDPTVAERLIARRRRGDPIDELTERELEVLALMAEGSSNAQIAERLVVTRRTVEAHIRAIMRKLDIVDSGDDHRRVRAVLTYLRASATARLPPTP